MRPGSWRGLPGRGRGVGKGAEAARARAAGGEAGAGPWGARSAAGKRWNGPSRHRTEGLRAPSTPLAHSGCDVRASLLARLPFDCRHCGASQATNGAKPPRAAPHPAKCPEPPCPPPRARHLAQHPGCEEKPAAAPALGVRAQGQRRGPLSHQVPLVLEFHTYHKVGRP